MEKSFFTNELIESYTNFKLNDRMPIKDALGDFELLNYQQFMNWWNNYPKDLEIDTDEMNDIFKTVFRFSCGFLNEDYINTAISNVTSFDSFDVLFAVHKKDDLQLNNYKTVYDFQLAKSYRVGGYIIIEKGECKKRPNIISSVLYKWNKSHHHINYRDVFSVNLVCCRYRDSSDTVPSFKCQLLLGAYLFIIKANPLYPQIGILELADGYTNIPGFIAYSKLGFVKDLSLYKDDCFHSLTTLPMSNILDKTTQDSIVQCASNDIALIVPKDVRELLYFYQQTQDDKEKQKELAILYNIIYRFELEPKELLKRVLFEDEYKEYDQLEEYIGEDEASVLFEILYNEDGSIKEKTIFKARILSYIKNETMKRIEEKRKPYRIGNRSREIPIKPVENPSKKKSRSQTRDRSRSRDKSRSRSRDSKSSTRKNKRVNSTNTI